MLIHYTGLIAIHVHVSLYSSFLKKRKQRQLLHVTEVESRVFLNLHGKRKLV